MKKYWNKLVLLTAALPLLFWGCNKETQSKFDVNSDAYIIRKNIDGEVKSATTFYVYANQSISSATVTPPAGQGEPFHLSRSEESSFTFQKEPSAAEFKSETAAPGLYVFDIESSEGVKVQQVDELEIFNLQVPVITSTTFEPANMALTVKWDSVANADGYVVKLLTKEERAVFTSYSVSPKTTELSINSANGHWSTQIYSGDKIKLNVQAFIFDSDATLVDNIYNIGEIAVAEKEITWGQ